MNDAAKDEHWLEYEVIEKDFTIFGGEKTKLVFSAKLKLMQRPFNLITEPENEAMEWFGSAKDVALTINPHAEISKLVMYAFPIRAELPIICGRACRGRVWKYISRRA